MHIELLNTDSPLWRALRRAYGKPYNQPFYFELCRLAARKFNRSVHFRSLYRDFLQTWKSFLKNSASMDEIDWCNTVWCLLEAETKANSRMRYYEDREAVRNTGHYHLDLKKWFPKIKCRKDLIRQRMVVLEAAKQCGIPPIQLFLDLGLVSLSLLGRKM